ncbi:MAG: hypothetical protein HY695_27945 [Deltaproteobacteria bacterium]|nr:hypothetical protein [Deltaproteobacteria bacterium]
MPTLGVVILTLNGMKHVAQCVESVKWADRIMVLHVGDGAPAILAGECSCLVYRRVGSTETLDGLPQEMNTDWILNLWGEETVDAALRDELAALCRKPVQRDLDSYRIPIRSLLMGRWVDGSVWEPSPATRLGRQFSLFPAGWRSGLGNGKRRIPLLGRGSICDHTLSELDYGLRQIQNVSDLWARLSQGRSPGSFAMIGSPLRTFFRLVFRNRALSNGIAGLTVATLAAYATFLSMAKLWEAQKGKEGKDHKDRGCDL